MIAKQADAAYLHGRSRQWLKFKCTRRQEFVIGGFTAPQGARTGFGALLFGYFRDDRVVYAGKVGIGFDEDTLQDLQARLQRRRRKTLPFAQDRPEGQEVRFVTPKLVREVVFTEWTDAGRLRHPRFKSLRRDKDAAEVRREA